MTRPDSPQKAFERDLALVVIGAWLFVAVVGTIAAIGGAFEPLVGGGFGCAVLTIAYLIATGDER